MNDLISKKTLCLVARFLDTEHAEEAGNEVNRILGDAQREVDALFERQGGVADMCDVTQIYARYGFRNECGWQQTEPLRACEEELCWELPEGLPLEEAQGLLAAFGAITIGVDDDFEDELLGQVPHPAALCLSESDEELDFVEDEEFIGFMIFDKKILH